jgi:hypothetical protein
VLVGPFTNICKETLREIIFACFYEYTIQFMSLLPDNSCITQLSNICSGLKAYHFSFISAKSISLRDLGYIENDE